MIEAAVIGTSIVSLTFLEKKGKLSLNHKIMKIIIGVYLIKIGYEGVDGILNSTLLN